MLTVATQRESATGNVRGRKVLHYDGAGELSLLIYDFQGNLTAATRALAVTYQSTPDWAPLAALTDAAAIRAAAAPFLEADRFTTTTAYDALDRVISSTTPDASTVVPTYNEANLLERLEVGVRGAAPAPLVTNLDYNAKGQRLRADFASATSTVYTYDPLTFLLMEQETTRAGDGAKLQDLRYTFDPVRNVVQVTDLAQQTVYFAGNVTDGTQRFEYDAIYRLTHATGREQPGQVGYALGPDKYPEAPFTTIPHRNDLQALLAYTEDYAYDAVGNLEETLHKAAGAGWTRSQTYLPGSNRIDRVSMPGDSASGPYSGTFVHDAAGNLTQTSNLASMTWDHGGRLVSADLRGGGTVYFTYDAGGQRVRKIVERTGVVEERVYVGGYERYRKRSGSSVILERESLHVSDSERRFALVETKTVDTSVPSLTPTPLFRLQFPNHIGSVCLETDLSGTPISYEEYYPYGGSSFRAGDVDKRYRFSGKERDEETGLYYFGARYYAPWLARWTSCDPAGFVDGPNVYAFVRNNPIRYADPQGTQSQDFRPFLALPDAERARFGRDNPDAATNLALAIEALPGGVSYNPKTTSYDRLLETYLELRQDSQQPRPAPAPAARESRPNEIVVGRRIAVLDPSGEGTRNEYRRGTQAELDAQEDMENRRIASAVGSGLAHAAGAIALNRAARPSGGSTSRPAPTYQAEGPNVSRVEGAATRPSRTPNARPNVTQETTLARLPERGNAGQENSPAAAAQYNAIVAKPFSAGKSVGREIFRDVRDALARSDALSPEAKANAFEEAGARIRALDPSWMLHRGRATNAAAIFTGDARPFGLAVDLEGKVWTTDNFVEGATFNRNGGFTIDYSKWTRR